MGTSGEEGDVIGKSGDQWGENPSGVNVSGCGEAWMDAEPTRHPETTTGGAAGVGGVRRTGGARGEKHWMLPEKQM